MTRKDRSTIFSSFWLRFNFHVFYCYHNLHYGSSETIQKVTNNITESFNSKYDVIVSGTTITKLLNDTTITQINDLIIPIFSRVVGTIMAHDIKHDPDAMENISTIAFERFNYVS